MRHMQLTAYRHGILIVALILACLGSPVLAGAATGHLPKTLAGITLGDPIEKYSSMVIPESRMGNRDALFMNEVDINPTAIPGIRGGSISSGNCSADERVITVKLKFVDTSEDLYNALEKQYEQAFGKPTKWLGDAFHNVISWQWTLREGDEEVEIVLTYSKDQEMRPGVSIKFVLRSAWRAEYEIYKQKRGSHMSMPYMHGQYSRSKLELFIPH